VQLSTKVSTLERQTPEKEPRKDSQDKANNTWAVRRWWHIFHSIIENTVLTLRIT